MGIDVSDDRPDRAAGRVARGGTQRVTGSAGGTQVRAVLPCG
jgi:hypothetical protein